jgi:hypothetical protein
MVRRDMIVPFQAAPRNSRPRAKRISGPESQRDPRLLKLIWLLAVRPPDSAPTILDGCGQRLVRLCAWSDEVHRKDRPEREEARGLENENSMRVVDQTGILESPRRKGVQRANEGSPARWS